MNIVQLQHSIGLTSPLHAIPTAALQDVLDDMCVGDLRANAPHCCISAFHRSGICVLCSISIALGILVCIHRLPLAPPAGCHDTHIIPNLSEDLPNS